MKKNLQKLFTLACVLATFVSIAQEGKKLPFQQSISKHNIAGRLHAPQQVTAASCGPDTLMYPYLKELVFSSPADSFWTDAMVGTVRTASQAYINTGTLNVVGIKFWGAAYSTSTAFQTLQVKLLLYNVGTNYKPTTAIDSTVVTITNTYGFYQANFVNAHAVTGNYAVAVKNLINDTVAVITNNAGASWQTTPYGETLAWRRFGSGTWNASLSFFGQDLEYMIFPIVNYNINGSFNASATTVCSGTPVTFTNTSTGPYADRMTNLRAFDKYWSLAAADSSFKWNYGTNNSWTVSMNGAYTYTTAGTYTTSLATQIVGYYSTCGDTARTSVTVNSADASVTAASNTITANAAGATYQWIDCNNGNQPIAGETNQSFVASTNGDYAVIVTQNGCSATSVCTNISSTAITKVMQSGFSVSPNPFNNNIVVNTGNVVADAILIKDLTGRVIKSVVPSAGKTLIDLHDLAASVYFVNINYNGNSQVVKLIKQ